MRVAVVERPGAHVRLRDMPIPAPGPGEVLVRVQACGICHTDLDIMAGRYGFARFPLVPGHEVAGTVADQGPGTLWPPVGSRVGLPWTYSSCRRCGYCRAGDSHLCGDMTVTGATAPGGYGEYLVAKADYLVPAPPELPAVELAPLMCAGLTAYSGLLRASPVYGQRVAVLGFGGLGEYTAWLAASMGARVCVVSGSGRKEAPARRAGAEVFIDRSAADPVAELRRWEGGVHLAVSTVPDSDLPSRVLPALVPGGNLVVLGIGTGPLQFDCHALIDRRIGVLGTPAGSVRDAARLVGLAARADNRPAVTTVPLGRVQEALGLTGSGEVTGRVVLEMG